MHRRRALTRSLQSRGNVSPFLTLSTFLLLLVQPLYASAQTPNTTTPPPKEARIKVRPTRNLVSGRVRIGDYVTFKVMETVTFPVGSEQKTVDADTLVFGRVTDRKHRVMMFQSGQFGVAVDTLKTKDGSEIPVYISRPNKDPDCKNKKSKKEYYTEATVPCIRGRVYQGKFTASLPSAVATAITAAALAFAEDPTAKAVAAVTVADQIAKQSGFSNILNGVDAEIDMDEVFDLVVPDPAKRSGVKPVPPF